MNLILSTLAAIILALPMSGLKCERQENPVGVSTRKPLFSWLPSSDGQSCYRIRVFNNEELDSEMWDSGWVDSKDCIDIKYAGKKLLSGRKYWWTLQLKDANGVVSPVSDTQTFITAFLDQADWGGEWIGYDKANSWDREDAHSELSARYLRATFGLQKEITAAYAHVCGVGYHEFYFNGERVGDQVLAPLPSEYNNELLSLTYDVTDLVKSGKNAIGVILGNGYYYNMQQGFAPKNNHTFGYPKLRFELDLFCADGEVRRIVSSAKGWRLNCDGPIRSNNMYDGEVYDATKEFDGWLDPDFDDSSWDRPEAVSVFGQALIKPQPSKGMKVFETLPAKSMTRLGDGWVLDFGQNLTGWVRMSVKAERGDTVRVDYAEKLYPDGTLDKSNLRDSYARDLYIAKGDGVETWAPAFSYHGFRYAYVSGLDYEPSKEDFSAEFVTNDIQRIGYFETDNAIFNQVIANAVETIKGTWKGLPMDCPQRAKRLPWLGDRNIEHLGEMYLFNMNSQYEYWFSQMSLAQRADGCVPDVAPAYWYNYSDNVSWPSIFVIGELNAYKMYGNARAMEQNYPNMAKWVSHLADCYMEDGIITKDRYGDWGVPPEDRSIKHTLDDSRKTDGMLIATAYYYMLLQDMAEIAEAIGRTEDIDSYLSVADMVLNAFNARFYDNEKNCYGNGTVTANILPAALGMVPEDRLDSVRAAVKNGLAANGGQITSGVIGLQWMMRGLHKLGLDDEAYYLATNTSYPSYGYMIEQGATTIWEYWNGDSIMDSSHNHVMLLGDLVPWCFEDLAGIKASSPAFRTVHMEPAFDTKFNHVKASLETPYGTVTSEWNRKKCGRIVWEFSIPSGVEAEVVLPDSTAKYTSGTHKLKLK